MHPLGQLIREAMEMRDPPLSYGDVERAGGPPKNTVQRLVKQPVKNMPDAATLHGLARALRIPVVVLVEKALQSIGLPSPAAMDTIDIESKIWADRDLDQETKEALVSVLRLKRNPPGGTSRSEHSRRTGT